MGALYDLVFFDDDVALAVLLPVLASHAWPPNPAHHDEESLTDC
jgi:hypothetical protein